MKQMIRNRLIHVYTVTLFSLISILLFCDYSSGNAIVFDFLFKPEVPLFSTLMKTWIMNLPLNFFLVFLIILVYLRKNNEYKIPHFRIFWLKMLFLVSFLSILGAIIDRFIVFSNVET
jgi:hypothetical protein